jgi:predicted DNA-binding transcriptional regulator AlpA
MTDTPASEKSSNYAPRTPHPYPLSLRPKDLADRLGITSRYLYILLKHPDPKRRLPAPYKIGRATLWRADEVQEWLDRQMVRDTA